MCPEQQLLSIYMDGELPSPWKEKMESHLTECSSCREKFENFKRLQELFKKDTRQRRTIVERNVPEGEQLPLHENPEALMLSSKEKVWRNLESGRRLRFDRSVRRGVQARGYNLLRRRLSIPLPAAAAAAVIIALVTALWVRGGSANNSGLAGVPLEPAGRTTSFMIAAEEEVPSIIPAADINGVLQYLGSERPDVIIFQLPESRNFLRSGEPAIVRAADYSGR